MGLIDLMLAVIIASLLMAAAVPAYVQFINRASVARAIGDIGSISIAIERFGIKNNGRLPNSLDERLMGVPFDPCGAPYQYLNIVAARPGNGVFRKDGKFNPLNSDFDLFSVGADGESMGPLSVSKRRKALEIV
jgi:general secretion pathway protein G